MRGGASTADGEKPLVTFATANATLIVWVVFLGFGSTFLAFYYSHIHYFPELEWEQSFSYLAATSVFGGGLVAVYGLLLYVPGWIWSEFLIFDAKLVQTRTLCYSVGGNEAIDPCFWKISLHLVLPFGVMMLALHLALWARHDALSIATALVGVVLVSWWSTSYLLRELEGELRDDKQGGEQDSSDWDSQAAGSLPSFLWKYAVTTALAAVSSIASLFVLNELLNPERESWTLLAICTASVVVTNLLVAVQFRQRPMRAAMTGIVAALMLMACGEILADTGRSQSERIMSRFGIGPASRVRLDLTAAGAERLKSAGLGAGDLALLSRLGEEYVIAGTAKGNCGHRVVLRKELVQSWTSLDTASDQGRAAPPPRSVRCVAACNSLLFLLLALIPLRVHR